MMRHLFAIMFVIAGLIALPNLAAAHANILGADPAKNAVLTAPPSAVNLMFGKALEPKFSAIRVFDASGKQVDKANTTVKGDGHNEMSVELPALPAGDYKVNWNIVSQDGHKMKGDYTFTIK
jgi:hypothetical protein